MQFEYKHDVIDIDSPKEIAEALRTKDFIVMTNGAVKIYTVSGLYLRITGDMDTMDALELLQLIDKDESLAVNNEAVSTAQEALGQCVAEVLLGEYDAMDIMSGSKDGFYAVLEEKLGGKYDISDAKFELRGEVDDDGYIKMVAIIEKFSRYD